MPDRTETDRTIWTRSALVGLIFVSLAAATYRLDVYRNHGFTLSPDSFAYLNGARHIRGVEIPDDWDDRAMTPRRAANDRPPLYPLFMNLAFAIAGDRPTPPAGIQAAVAMGADSWHLRFLESRENLYAVEVAQHLVGIIATVLCFVTVLLWTRRPWLAAVAALAAVGLRPSWAEVFEPWILTESLAGGLLVAVVLLVTMALRGDRAHPSWAVAASFGAGLLVLLRAEMILLGPVFLLGLWWFRRRTFKWLMMLVVPWGLIVGGLVVKNGVQAGFWGLSSTSGSTVVSHFKEPEAFSDPRVSELIREFQTEKYDGAMIARALVLRHGLSYGDASSLLNRQILGALVRHPFSYLRSVIAAFGDSMLPTEFFEYWRWPGPALRWVVCLFLLLAVIVGAGVFFMGLPPAATLTGYAFFWRALSVSLLSAADNGFRYSFPAQALIILAAAAVWHALLVKRRPRT